MQAINGNVTIPVVQVRAAVNQREWVNAIFWYFNESANIAEESHLSLLKLIQVADLEIFSTY